MTEHDKLDDLLTELSTIAEDIQMEIDRPQDTDEIMIKDFAEGTMSRATTWRTIRRKSENSSKLDEGEEQ